jgi:hypothetical protein
LENVQFESQKELAQHKSSGVEIVFIQVCASARIVRKAMCKEDGAVPSGAASIKPRDDVSRTARTRSTTTLLLQQTPRGLKQKKT